MKDYEHVVIWLDYFNKTLPRNKGRRLSKEKCVFDPSLKELIDASNSAGLQPKETEEQVRYSKKTICQVRIHRSTKNRKKTTILEKISQN